MRDEIPLPVRLKEKRAYRSAAIVLVLSLLLSGCAGPRTQLMQIVRTDLSAARFTQAYETYKKKVAKTERVDELLNLGLLAFEAGDYSTSFQALSDAERLGEERETKSLSREAAGIVISDRVRAYQGTVFDKAMLHYYRGLGFLAQNDLSSATVEGRRIAGYLEVNARESKHTYKDDAFLQYYSGALYDAFGQVNDAWISYKRSQEIYQDYYGLREPSFLCPVTLAAVRKVGHAESERELEKRCPEAAEKVNTESGRVIVICEAGQAPPIREQNIMVPIYKSDPHEFADEAERERYAGEVAHRRGDLYDYNRIELDYFLRVALPYYDEKETGSAVCQVVIRDTSGWEQPAALSENIEGILRKDLSDREPAILTRAITRALIKYAAAKVAKQAGKQRSDLTGDILGTIVNAAGAATEAADTRSWETLPARIYVSDFRLPPGSHSLRAVFLDELGSPMFRHDFPLVEIRKGEIVFLRARCVR